MSETGPRPARPRAQALATLAGTLLVVVAEFAILTTLYHSGDGVDREHQRYAQVRGALSTWQPGSPTGPVERAVAALSRSDAGTARLERLTRAWASDPRPAAFADVKAASARLGDSIASDEARTDLRAALIRAGLLIAASVGWFLWFRRVVRRHRQLEHDLTAAQVVLAGERRLTALVRNSADMVVVLEPDTTISFVSSSSQAGLGIAPEALIGQQILDLLGEEDVPSFTSLLASSREGDHPVMLRARHADGRTLMLEGTLTNLLADAAVGGWLLTVRDVTERIALQDELSHQALHDSLTGLANRRLFGDRLAHALRRRSHGAEPLVVLLLDLDDFKNVNDSLGHAVGDEVLVAFGERVAESIRAEDTAARLGGDEFAVLMENADLETAQRVAERLVEALDMPVLAGEQLLAVRASIGLAVAMPGETSAEEALRNADVAMYWAKDRGKGNVAVYDSSLHAAALELLALRTELSDGIVNDQLVLHFQPTVDLGRGTITGFEALVRWQHPTRGLLFPVDFIDVAEQSGLVVPLGSWVMREACRGAAGMQSASQRPTIAVNIAAKQLAAPGFADEVLEALEASGLPADRLVLEITESMLLDDKDAVITILGRLRERGIRVAIDDFGTGYSSLSYLAELPVDVLKVDKSFVDHICDGGSSLVEAIIAMSESLRLTTVAEGVELPAQADWLEDAGCSVGQGYLWSRPVPLEAASNLLATGVRLEPALDDPTDPDLRIAG